MRREQGPQQRGGWRLLLHAAPQDLVGRNQHDAYDEGHGEGADEALPDAGLSVLFLGMHWGWKSREGKETWREGSGGREVTFVRSNICETGFTSFSTSPVSSS